MPELLFELHLEYKTDESSLHEDGKVGEYIGSGQSRVTRRQR